MTLHDVREITPLIDGFYNVTAPDRCLCIADLDPVMVSFMATTTPSFTPVLIGRRYAMFSRKQAVLTFVTGRRKP